MAVVIVTHNSGTDIGACLAALPPAAGPVVVVDNGSTDGTVAAVAGLARPGLRLIEAGGNLGFARGANLGAAAAAGTEFLLFLNPDARTDPGAVAALAGAAARHPGHAILAGAGRDPSGAYLRGSARRAPGVWAMVAAALGLRALFPGSRLFDGLSLRPAALRAEVADVAMVPGAAMLVRRAAWTALGGFDPRFFMYGEDADLCARARRAGWKVGLVPGAGYRHAVGGSSASAAAMHCLLLKGEITELRLNGPLRLRLLAGPLLTLHVALRALAEPLRPGGGTTWRSVWRRRRDWRAGYPARPADGAGGQGG